MAGRPTAESGDPLAATQRSAATESRPRSDGSGLAYDPKQLAWVRHGVDEAGDPAEAGFELGATMQSRFERLAQPLLGRWLEGSISRDDLEHELWVLPERVVGEFSTHSDATEPLRRRGLGWLQRAAADLIARRIVSKAERDELARRCEQMADRFTLRPWREADAARYVELLQDPRVWEHLPEAFPHPLTLDTARSMIELSNQAAHHEVVAVERGGEIVGQVRLEFEPGARELRAARQAEVSYWLGSEYWGHGLMSDVLLLHTRHAFATYGPASIFARIRAENGASARVASKCRYRFEGELGSELDGTAGMQTYRCFRGSFFEPSGSGQDANSTATMSGPV